MRHSEEIAKLATALAKAQGAIEDAEKDSTNPHFKSKYADLASLRAVIRHPLSSNGLSILQPTRTNGNAVEVETMLLHESGEFVSEILAIPLGQVTPQAIGSAATYAKRYGLMGMLGLAASEDDDDGEVAMGRDSETRPDKWSGKEGPNQATRERDQLEVARQEKLGTLHKVGREKAGLGSQQFSAWWRRLNEGQQAALEPILADLMDIQRDADAAGVPNVMAG